MWLSVGSYQGLAGPVMPWRASTEPTAHRVIGIPYTAATALAITGTCLDHPPAAIAANSAPAAPTTAVPTAHRHAIPHQTTSTKSDGGHVLICIPH